MLCENAYYLTPDDLVRMWDENRDSKCKGLPNCTGVKCEDCILNKVLCQPDFGDTELHNVFDVLELIEQWGKENPVVTNAGKV